jgi:hypothetical protein
MARMIASPVDGSLWAGAGAAPDCGCGDPHETTVALAMSPPRAILRAEQLPVERNECMSFPGKWFTRS